ncbi:fatty acid desaturase [Nitzschia inconspicua]|uniref:Fatty acid desaturase n=1 Tax=Nitzschia inconspicua TaxID=303405 RepID=A0A9K3PH61_9STRA|nr:fatty acid desaturase [Nitzschia inconspicua]
MAPDADKLRLRKSVLSSGQPGIDDHGREETIDRLVTLKSLRGNEVCIDGVIYDITSFDHPGGETIRVFGGNDATIQYKMIHPYHTAKHLEKMKVVGRVPDYVSEYKWDTDFEREMKKEVFKIVHRGKEFGTTGYFVRATVYIFVFLVLQFQWMQQTSFPLAIVYGISMAFIGLNVQHDANHGAASKRVWINDLLGLGADWIGGSKYLWMEKHWTHHTYTNHRDLDPDGLAAEPFLLFNDYDLLSPKRAPYHAFQAFYFVLVLAGYWISSVVDFPMIYNLQDRGTLEVGIRLDNDWIQSKRKYGFGLRLLYLFCNVVVPLYNNFSLVTLAQINVMGISGSLTLGLLFTLSHNFDGADRDPTKPVRETGEPVCWFKSQVETSSTYGGFVAGCLTGGLNFQIEHHLFPRMSSAWYPYIAPTVRRVCEKHGVKYTFFPYVWQNMYSTFKYTHEVGNGSHWKNNPFKGET